MSINYATATEQEAVLTSEKGKRWLEEMAGFPEQVVTTEPPPISVATDAEILPAREFSIGKQLHAISIPDVSSECKQKLQADGSIDRKTIVETFASESEKQLQSIASFRGKQKDHSIESAETHSASAEKRSVPSQDHASSSISENKTAASKTSGLDSEPDEPTSDSPSGDLAGVVESILKRTTAGRSAVILFVGAMENQHVDTTAAEVGSQLAKLRRGSVLLVDANAKTKNLTRATGIQQQPGLSEALLGSANGLGLIRKGAASGVDFLGYGTQGFSHSQYQPEARALVTELAEHYDYICISAGSSQSVDAKIWSDVADGCYLLVSRTNDHPTLARSAVAELRSSGAKLLGCVVTESEG